MKKLDVFAGALCGCVLEWFGSRGVWTTFMDTDGCIVHCYAGWGRHAGPDTVAKAMHSERAKICRKESAGSKDVKS